MKYEYKCKKKKNFIGFFKKIKNHFSLKKLEKKG